MVKKIIFLLIVILLMVVGCGITETTEKLPVTKEEQVVVECPEWAETLIPENMLLIGSIQGGMNQDWKMRAKEGDINYWEDDSKMIVLGDGGLHVTNRVIFYPGSDPGQNINYYYMGLEDDGTIDGLSYSKRIVSDEGVTLGSNNFLIKSLILKPIEGTGDPWGPYSISHEFEIIDYKFVSCNLIEK